MVAKSKKRAGKEEAVLATKLETLELFRFDGAIEGSHIELVDEEALKKYFGPNVGTSLASELRGYHPPAAAKLSLSVLNENSNEDICLKATGYGDGSGWSSRTKRFFSNLAFVPSPSKLPFLVARTLTDKDRVGNWRLVYAKIEGGLNPYKPDIDVQTGRAKNRKVILVWSAEVVGADGRVDVFPDYVYTCWIWG